MMEQRNQMLKQLGLNKKENSKVVSGTLRVFRATSQAMQILCTILKIVLVFLVFVYFSLFFY